MTEISTQTEDLGILSISWALRCGSHLLSFMEEETQTNSALN